ncbi:uncharacterized protein BXZ73DRAFT_16075, partial [Epithele typhae]|uniref:uncharacterized protein n=1 Tax=Epithele typhae TaxID=378194 RepID=UPI0020075137
DMTSYIRAVSLAIAFYDYFITLPAEYRFYASQRSWRLSPGCILFIAIRYSSIAVLLFSSVGYYSTSFSTALCNRYFIAAPVFKVLQTMISQVVLGVRTMNLSRRATWVTRTISITFMVCTMAEWFLNLWNRVRKCMPYALRATPYISHCWQLCTAGNAPPVLTAWLYYMFAMTYDVVTLVISTAYLINLGSNSGKMAQLVRIMLTDGLIYFVTLTGANILNLILYRSSIESVQSSGVSIGYTVTWIMSQRILIHLQDATTVHNRAIATQVVVSRSLHSIPRAVPNQFESE